jgi:DNA-binding MarR family transcriptional regulator
MVSSPSSSSGSKLIGKLRSALEPVVLEGLSLEVLSALLTIAAEPGLSVNELADRLNAPQQTASRYASVLLGRYQEPMSVSTQRPKQPLVVQEVHANDPRKRAMFLTDRGNEFVAHLVSLLSDKKIT